MAFSPFPAKLPRSGTLMRPTDQMLRWIEECEVAAKEHDASRLINLLLRIYAVLATEFGRMPRGFVDA
jgi:hypothetical protein